MRKITTHVVEGDAANHQLRITVVDNPGDCTHCHYEIWGFDTETNRSDPNDYPSGEIDLFFQNGPIKDVGVNGITGEALLAILIDRYEGFQAGQFACEENEAALQGCRLALAALQRRTRDRIARGVEGSHQE